MVHEYRQPDYNDICGPDNGQCSHTCVAMPDLHHAIRRFTCGCPPDMVLDEDNKTCKKITSMGNSSQEPTNADKIEAASQIEAVPLPPDDDGISPVGVVIGASSFGVVILILVILFINFYLIYISFLFLGFNSPLL